VISQLIVAYVIELLGMFGVEKSPFAFRKLAGLVSFSAVSCFPVEAIVCGQTNIGL
ncbi:MAG: DMT family transporter, partial [Veillonella sp.]|nr:DMT family transporter [Veillonella sp.]